MDNERRQFLATAAVAGMGTVALASLLHANDKPKDDKKDKKKDEPEEEVGAAEDLMREHGVLNRVLLIYEEGLRRLREKEDVSPDVFHKPATLVRKFVEDYHKKLEEDSVFPEFEKKQKHVERVRILKEQHKAGRVVTDVVLRLAEPEAFRKMEARKQPAGA
jgi:Hemerythrin HHE cation binding domain